MPATKMTPAQIEEALRYHTGTEHWYEYKLLGFGSRVFTFTDGVKAMVEMCGAYWLLDAIASHQPTARKKCEGIQFWTLKKNKTGTGAVLTCVADSNLPPVVKQKIEFTDFPLDEIKLYCAEGGPDGGWVVLLPGEY